MEDLPNMNAFQDAMNAAILREAPACPECGAAAEEATTERHTEAAEDVVEWALETYRCTQGHRYFRRFELDRYTAEERKAELDKALKRIEYVKEAPHSFAEAFRPGLAYAIAHRDYPPRELPDLMERYREARSALT